MVAVVMNPVQHNVDRFYVGMAAIFVLIAFGGFAPTYWLQLVPGTFVGPPLLHIHGLLFSAWPLLLLTQAMLVANRRCAANRERAKAMLAEHERCGGIQQRAIERARDRPLRSSAKWRCCPLVGADVVAVAS